MEVLVLEALQNIVEVVAVVTHRQVKLEEVLVLAHMAVQVHK